MRPIETIAAVVEAYGRGEVELEPIGESARGAGGGIYTINFPGGKFKALHPYDRRPFPGLDEGQGNAGDERLRPYPGGPVFRRPTRSWRRNRPIV